MYIYIYSWCITLYIQSPRTHTPTPTPDHFETNNQQMWNEVICASLTLVSTLFYFVWYWGWGCSQGVLHMLYYILHATCCYTTYHNIICHVMSYTIVPKAANNKHTNMNDN